MSYKIEGIGRNKKKISNKISPNFLNSAINPRRFQIYWKKLRLFLKLFFLLILLGLIFSKYGSNLKCWITNAFYGSTNKLGLSLEKVIIQANDNIQAKKILNWLPLKRGTTILEIDLNKLKDEIENNPWIKEALVIRKLPDTLHIKILEKKAIACWIKNQENHFLIDEDGKIIQPIKITEKSNQINKLLRITGESANSSVKELIDNLEDFDDIKNKILLAIRYGNRRWDLILDQNITVKMPENNLISALKYLSDLEKKDQLFDNGIKIIDLRINDKIFITHQ